MLTTTPGLSIPDDTVEGVNAHGRDPYEPVTTTSEARSYLRRLIASWAPPWHAEALCGEFGDVGPRGFRLEANPINRHSTSAAVVLSVVNA
jgi:hypothetical protein